MAYYHGASGLTSRPDPVRAFSFVPASVGAATQVKVEIIHISLVDAVQTKGIRKMRKREKKKMEEAKKKDQIA